MITDFKKIEKAIIQELIKSRLKNRADLNLFKREIAKKYKVPLPSNLQLLEVYHKFLKDQNLKPSEKLEKLLQTRPLRSLSGIVNITVLTKPYPCPGRCIFCPKEKGIPKSYLSGEPAVERAKKLNYDPYWQVRRRIEMLESEGHPTDKIELRIVGGTWSYYPKNYQLWFIKRCFDACNQKSRNRKFIAMAINFLQLEKSQRRNEKAKNRIVGISIETRPDFINEEEVKWLRGLGITMVEMGVQTVFNDVLKENQTALNVEKIAQATKILKDAGFKVLYHLMINLPGSNPKRDLESFRIIFSDGRFRPDWIKIYPVLIIKDTQLYQLWKKRKYSPYPNQKLIDLLIEIKKILPPWVRVTRILRDIPATKIEAGCKISNLRQVLKREMEKRGFSCHCIRCREVRERYNLKEKVYLFREDYDASEGKEIFLSFENKNRTKLFSYLRLRIPSQVFEEKKHFLPILDNSAIIREIQTLGEMVPIGIKKIAPQHRGLGKELVRETEKIVKKEFGLSKIAVISGIGARAYWRKLGYKLKDSYMIKEIE